MGRVSELASAMIRADWDNFLAAGMENEWQEDRGGGAPGWEERVVSGKTIAMSVERREYI